MTFRYWICTLNNPEKFAMSEDKSVDPEMLLQSIAYEMNADYAIGQLEKGDKAETLHLQFMLYFASAIRGTAFGDLPFFHQGVRNAKSVINYVTKEETRVAGPWETGICPISMKKGPNWEEILKNAEEDKFTEIPAEIQIKYHFQLQSIATKKKNSLPYDRPNRYGLWVHDKPGTGKTTYVRETYPNSYWKPKSKWYNGYNGQDCIVIDEVDPFYIKNGGLEQLKAICNTGPHLAEIKGGAIWLRNFSTIVTTMYSIDELAEACKLDEVEKGALKARFKEFFLEDFKKHVENM